MLGVPLGELAVLAVGIVTGGVVTGLLAGLFGVGGGALIVPVLYEVFRVLDVPEAIRMQLCVGTSLAIIVPTSIRSFLAHRARGNLPLEILRMWAPPVAIGTALGAVIAALAPSWIFKLAFVIIAASVATRMFLGNDGRQLADKLPGTKAMAAYGLFIGLYSSLMGVGGGAVAVMILMLYSTPIHIAVGISAGVGVVISLVGTVGFMIAGLPHQELMPPLSIGYVSLIGLVLMAPITTALAPYGARLSHSISKRKLEIAFGVFLLAVSCRFIVSLL